MKVDYLYIKSQFKNLKNIKINFDENHLMTVIIGGNGSGKSNVLEALVAIFRNLDLGEAPDFAYEIKYKLGGDSHTKWITVIADPVAKTLSQQYQVTSSNSINEVGKDIPLSKVKRDKAGHSDFLPDHVFAYYSGPSDRLEKYFKKHRTNFYRKLLKSEVDLQSDIRPLFYAKPFHSQFVLLAFFLSKQADQEKKFLKTHLGIESLDSVHFVMRKPKWTKTKNKKELFWGADGVVRDFLELLYPHCLAPVKVTRQEDVGLTGSDIKNEFFHLFLPNVEVLREFAKGLSPDVFFKMLESTLLSEIISEVSVRVKVSSSDQPLSFRELSEGEQQLLTVLGLLKFTGGKNTLFLLDEPDTHLNPAWTVKYLQFLKEFVPEEDTSHLLMVSHHPLAIAELEKEQVQVMWRDEENQVHAQEPFESPRGMGYAGILTSDMFGLNSTLDTPTQDLIRERRSLALLKKLNDDQLNRLKELNEMLENSGFSTENKDAEYSEYLRARNKQNKELFERDMPTPDVREQRRKIADEILTELSED
uniref:Chromosome segregation protein SMC n=1 Tax=OCS116 cluster bacterium TaxID=2030921 RepID=A0A2A4YZN5_9PROT